MGFWKSLGKGIGIGIGVGTGLAFGGAIFGGFDRLFSGGCRSQDFCGYQQHQFSRMDAYLQGRRDQARVDRSAMQMAALYYGAGAWGCC